MLFEEDTKICQKNFDKIIDVKQAKDTIDKISRNYSKFIEKQNKLVADFLKAQ